MINAKRLHRPRRPALLLLVLLLVALLSACTGAQTEVIGAGVPTDGAGVEGGTIEAGEPQGAISTEAPSRPVGASLGDVEIPKDALDEIADALEDLGRGDVADAESTLKGLANHPKAGFLANYNLGVIAERKGRSAEAMNFWQESLRLNPDFSPSLENMCRTYVREGKANIGLNTADTYVRQSPNNARHANVRMMVLLALGRHEDVIREAKALLKKDERDIRAMVNLGSAYQSLGKYELASDILGGVLNITDTPSVVAEVRYKLGLIHLAQDREPRAISEFERALAARPDFAEALNNLGLLYHKSRDFAGAARQFETALSVYPGFVEAQLNLGNAYKGLGRYTDAETAFKRVMLMDARYPDAYFNLGVLYLDAKIEGRDPKQQYQIAIDNFNRYKSEMKAKLSREDPADKYIEEAKKKIELEKKREALRREQLREAEEAEKAGPDGPGEGGDEDVQELPPEGEDK